MKTNEKGLVSITVTVIMMLVISITVLSFAQIIRHEQRQALDSQLSSQAFYAAESGINDARKFIATLGEAIPPAKTECGPQGVYTSTVLPMVIDASTNTRYSCLLINGTPKSLAYSLSTSEPSTVFPIDAGGQTIDKLDISWKPSTDANPLLGCPSSPTVSSALPAANDPNGALLPNPVVWSCKGYGILRLDIVPLAALNRSSFMANSFTAFITPTTAAVQEVNYNNGSNINGGQAAQGIRPAATCNATSCKVTIKCLGGSSYYVRASAIYRDAGLTIVAKNNTTGELSLQGAQIVIDSTGRSQDVLRRIQVRVPLTNDGLHGDYAIQSTDSMCKQFKTYGSGYTNDTPACP